ncbi:hypothetical protein F4781DRAFT_436616 [Annulohypoxylon bovei var. microspora]|nr:hypothetical protein F4781DRAFT_436616 [Annulohypoxylon bovei var. microspora]
MNSTLDTRDPYTFVVQCSPYTGKDKQPRKGAKGVNCHFKNNFHSYTFDGASESKKSERRTKAGCNPTKKNICKIDDKFKNSKGCDEFPLASTSEADQVDQIFRCVPEGDNSSQGGQVRGAMEASNICDKKYPCSFTFSFEGASTYRYCNASTDCVSDGNLFTKGNIPVKSDLQVEPGVTKGGYYQLRSGATIYSPTDLAIGTVAVRNAYAHQTIDEAEAVYLESRGLFEDDGEEDEELIKDEVVKKL